MRIVADMFGLSSLELQRPFRNCSRRLGTAKKESEAKNAVLLKTCS